MPLPEVGEPAHAYAPCVMELQAVQEAQYWVDYWFDEMLVPPFNHIVWFNYNSALMDLSAALDEYNHCLG